MSDTLKQSTPALTLNDQVEALFAEVQKRKAEINSATKEQYVTNCMFQFSNASETIDIRTIRFPNKVQEYVAFLIGRFRDYEDAAKLLGIDPPKEFTWYGATFNEWVNDFKIRATILDLTAKKEKLFKMEEKLLKIASPEFLQALQLKEIQAELDA